MYTYLTDLAKLVSYKPDMDDIGDLPDGGMPF